MAWVEKQHTTVFEEAELPIHGLFFVDGDVLARTYSYDWTKDKKHPMVMFPSNNAFRLWETSRPEMGATLNLFGATDLPLYSNRDEAFSYLKDSTEQFGFVVIKKGDYQIEVIGLDDNGQLEQVGYFVIKKEENQLEIIGQNDDEHFLLTYDNAHRWIENIERIKEFPAQ